MLTLLPGVLTLIVLFVLHSAAVGAAALPAALCQVPWGGAGKTYLHLFFALLLGFLVNIAMLFALGMAGFFDKAAVLIAAAAMLILAAPRLRGVLAPLRRMSRPDTLQAATAIVALLLLFLSVIVAFHPPGHFDDSMYQLPLARGYVEHKAILLDPYVRFPLFPQNINLLFALGLMFGGDVAAQAFSSLPLFVMGLGLIGTSWWLLATPHTGILAATLLFMIGAIKRTLGFAYIDNGLGMFCWAASLAIVVWAQQTHSAQQGEQKGGAWHWLVLAGLMAGGAAGSKYFGLVLAAILGAYLLVWRRDWKASLIYSTATVLAGGWWYVRSFVISGDPFHPVGGGVFGYYLWDAQDLLLQAQEQATHGTSRNPLALWSALNAAHVPIWILAFVSLFFWNTPRAIRTLQAIFLAYFAFWFFVTQVWRYLAPIYAVATLLSCYTLFRAYAWLSERTGKTWLSGKGIGIAVLAVFLLGYTADRVRSYSTAMTHWDDTLQEEAGYRLFEEANARIPEYGPRLVQLGFEKYRYFFNGTVIGDWFGPGRYRDMLDCESGSCQPPVPEAMRKYMERVGARMLVVSKEVYQGFDTARNRGEFDVLQQGSSGVLLGLAR